jgi:hypothetical protein
MAKTSQCCKHRKHGWACGNQNCTSIWTHCIICHVMKLDRYAMKCRQEDSKLISCFTRKATGQVQLAIHYLESPQWEKSAVIYLFPLFFPSTIKTFIKCFVKCLRFKERVQQPNGMSSFPRWPLHFWSWRVIACLWHDATIQVDNCWQFLIWKSKYNLTLYSVPGGKVSI